MTGKVGAKHSSPWQDRVRISPTSHRIRRRIHRGIGNVIFLPDTNAISVFLKGHDEQLNGLMTKHWEQIRLSTIVIAEREYGIIRHKSGRKYQDRFKAMVELLPQVDFTREDSTQYAILRTTLERIGRNIGPMDTLIAAQALRIGATVVTHNVGEFKRVPKLKVIDWQTASV